MIASMAASLMLNLGITTVPHAQNLNQLWVLPDTTPIIRTVKTTDDDIDSGDDLGSNLYEYLDPYEAKIIYLESRGQESATNGRYYGLFQLDLSYLKGDLSRENQFRVAKQYLKDRYHGSWQEAYNFHIANNWW